MSVAFSVESHADLLRIGDGSRERAAKVALGLVEACLGLADMLAALSARAMPRASWYPPQTSRRVPRLYEVVDGDVGIIHILHGAMDDEPILFPDA